MSNEDNLNEDVLDSMSGEIVESGKQELRIFITEEDRLGTDVTKMSNFFESYIQQLTCELSTNTAVNDIENIPIADIGIINEVVHLAVVMMNGDYGYVPDFDSLLRLLTKNRPKLPIKRIMLQKSRPLRSCVFRKTASLAVFTTA